MFLSVLFILSVTAGILLLVTRRRLKQQRKSANIQGWVKDQDLDGGGAHTYLNQELGLMAKPDVLQATPEGKIRVTELKSSRCYGDKPFYPDLLQMTAEMMATGAEEAELRYGNGKTFMYSINDAVIKESSQDVLKALKSMRQDLQEKRRPKGTPAAKKCACCAVRAGCDFSESAGHC